MITFFDSVIGQANEMVSNARVDMYFYGNALGVDAKNGTSKNLGEYK